MVLWDRAHTSAQLVNILQVAVKQALQSAHSRRPPARRSQFSGIPAPTYTHVLYYTLYRTVFRVTWRTKFLFIRMTTRSCIGLNFIIVYNRLNIFSLRSVSILIREDQKWFYGFLCVKIQQIPIYNYKYKCLLFGQW